MRVELDWKGPIIDTEDARLNEGPPALYYYTAHRKTDILYIGKCWGTTPLERCYARDKRPLGKYLKRHHDIEQINMYVTALSVPGRLTRQMLADVESLLIMREQPIGNIQAKKSRVRRKGLVVICNGQWSGAKTKYIDR